MVIILRGQWRSCWFAISKGKMLHCIHHSDIPFQSLRPQACHQATQALVIMIQFSSYCWEDARISVLQDKSLAINFPISPHELAATVFRARESTAMESGRGPHAHKRSFLSSLELCRWMPQSRWTPRVCLCQRRCNTWRVKQTGWGFCRQRRHLRSPVA